MASKERCLGSLKANGRHIEYAIAGKADAKLEILESGTLCGILIRIFMVSAQENGEPVLLFYPMGASRSFSAVFHGPAKSAGLQLICPLSDHSMKHWSEA